MTLMIAGERSGVGKTTVVLAILAYLRHQEMAVQSFKVGPDYIDPMFHQAITGQPCRNLDPVLTSEAYVQQCFQFHSQAAPWSLVEGAMGLFDGAKTDSDWGSTAHVARLLGLPVLLVLDCGRLSRSVAAIVHGYRTFDPQVKLAGVVLNQVGSDRHLQFLKSALAPLEVPVLGTLFREDKISLPDRHLGLVPTGELDFFPQVVQQLTDLGQNSFIWERLQPLLARPAPRYMSPSRQTLKPPPSNQPLRLAVARDQAFNFYYPDNLELLEQLGAELVFWSPMEDFFPKKVHGMLFGGGFPEIFAAALAANQDGRQAVEAAILRGMPTYAECGGLMYLCQHLTDLQGKSFPMIGVLPTDCTMTPRLTLGYRRAVARYSSSLVAAGTEVCGHEFHRSQVVDAPTEPLFHLASYSATQRVLQMEGWRLHQVHASYLHLHWGEQPELPQRFLAYCRQWQQTLAYR